MSASKSALFTIFAIATLAAFVTTANAQNNQGQVGKPKIQVQVQPAVQPQVQPQGPIQPLGVMTRFISLSRPWQVSGSTPSQSGGISTLVLPGSGQTSFWCQYGNQITSVTQGSVADRAGLESGDIILTLNGYRILSSRSLRRAVAFSQYRRVSCDVVNIRTGMLTTVWCDFTGGGFTPPQPSFGQPSNNSAAGNKR